MVGALLRGRKCAIFFCLNLGVVGRVLFFLSGFTRDLNHLDELFTLF